MFNSRRSDRTSPERPYRGVSRPKRLGRVAKVAAVLAASAALVPTVVAAPAEAARQQDFRVTCFNFGDPTLNVCVCESGDRRWFC
jgi:hypothetical protein